MAQNLAQLSPELLLLIASYLPQIDLLNVALVCKYLRIVTEPELYREYHAPDSGHRSLVQYIEALLREPRRLRQVSTFCPLSRLANVEMILQVKSLRIPAVEILQPITEFDEYGHDPEFLW